MIAVTDVVGPSTESDDPRIAAARRHGAELLLPVAGETEGGGVQRAHLTVLGREGLLGLADAAAPAPAAVTREVGELLAGACGNTWFCWAQHHTPTAMVTGAKSTPDAPYADDLRQDLGPAMVSGSALSGIAFAHLRRPGDPQVTARREGPGWVLDGSLDWVTSWGLAQVWLVAATVIDAAGRPDGRILWALPDVEPADGLESGPPLRLAAMGGTWTCPLRLQGFRVGADRVVAVTDAQQWLATDALRTINASPPAFGVARSALGALHSLGVQRESAQAIETALALAERVREVRRQAYALIDEARPQEHHDLRLQLRAEALMLGIESATAYVTASAGSAMLLGHSAQRWYREAGFHLVQAQTEAVRAATLRRLAVTASSTG